MAATNEWTVEELSAAVEAYLQMLGLEKRGEKYNKAAVQRMLLAGPISGRSTTEQRMQNISHVLNTMDRHWIKGYQPLPNVGAGTAETMRRIIEDYTAPDAAPLPSRPPIAAAASRTLPATGYWMFVCNRNIWDGEGWLQKPDETFLYKVSKHNRDEVQVGDLGVLRINARRRTSALSARPAGIYAVVEAIGRPQLQADPSETHYIDSADGREVTWRVQLKLIANLASRPISAGELPPGDEFQHFSRPLQTSTIPITRRAFSELYRRAGIVRPGLTDEEKAATVTGVRALEIEAGNADPKRKSRISKYIERGPIGAKVKEIRGCRCQLCEALRAPPVAFVKKNGYPFAEAHHVQPVSLLLAGTLAASNIMVLCPNHHRQAHLGDFEVTNDQPHQWRVQLDGAVFDIPKTEIK
ncbi:EVE domain-containing protein [Mesorhizobium sp.]|uniref:EVE domain-containing protein n=1 Tax=Mesorhizobium sp. TaxID=1871066 RepID=UPI0025BA29F7|nr:EVE domain-containing protein [Mesorhizobium sp.]